MPKSKLKDEEGLEFLSWKIKKLERKLRRRNRDSDRESKRDRSRSRSRRSRARDPSPPSPSPSLAPQDVDISGEQELEYLTRSSSPIDDVLPDDLNTEFSGQEITTSNPRENLKMSQTASNSTSTDTAPNDQIDSIILQILGEDPLSKSDFGKELHNELARRLEHITTTGLDKDSRKMLSEKYLIPSNCTLIAAPQLNPEIKAALPDFTLKRDRGIEARQKHLTSAISCLGQAITSLMQSADKNSELLKMLMDTIRILCDVQHTDSLKRRYFACSSLKKDINDQLIHTKIDKLLFGQNLAETLKAAKAVSKSGAEIKVDSFNKNLKKPTQPNPSTSRNLNWKAPPPPRRQSMMTGGAQKNRQPPPRKLDTSLKPSRRQWKQTRRQ